MTKSEYYHVRPPKYNPLHHAIKNINPVYLRFRRDGEDINGDRYHSTWTNSPFSIPRGKFRGIDIGKHNTARLAVLAAAGLAYKHRDRIAKVAKNLKNKIAQKIRK